MKITMYEFIGMVKDGKASDITTDFMLDREKYNLSSFLNTYALDINSLKWEVEIIEEEKVQEEKKIPEKIYWVVNDDNYKTKVYNREFKGYKYNFEELSDMYRQKINEIIDYLHYFKSKEGDPNGNK